MISWSVLDHERAPKLAYDALRAACAPVIVVADRLPASVHPGEAFTIDVHVVSDRRVELPGLQCVATLSWPGGAHRWRFAGDVPADSCVRVGSLQIEAPDAPDGSVVVLELEVTGAGEPVTDRDETIVKR